MKSRSCAMTAKEAFLELFHAGNFPAGSKIPSEIQMAKTLGVSRETWRKALTLLRQDGIVISRHGSGTYICEHSEQIANDLSQLQSMTKMIADAGISDCKIFSAFTMSVAPSEVCEFFQADENTEFCLVQITRYTGENVICASKLYMLAEFAEGLSSSNMPSSVFKHLEEKHGVIAHHALSEIFIPSYKDELRQRLNLPKGIEAFGLRQQHYDSRGRAILYSFDYLRSDYFHFTILRTRP